MWLTVFTSRFKLEVKTDMLFYYVLVDSLIEVYIMPYICWLRGWLPR